MTNRLSMLLKKFSIPSLFLVLGLILIIVAISNNQGTTFTVAAILMFVAGAMSILYSAGKMSSKMVYILGAGAGIAGLVTIFISAKSVYDTTVYEKNYKKCKALAVQNLEDVRYIQKAYAEENGTYLGTWEELVDYAKNGKVPFVNSIGVVPNRKISMEENKYLYTNNPPIDNNMTEEQAYRLSKWTEGPNWQADFADFVRDTIQVSLWETKFKSRSYRVAREKQGFYAFSPDSLPIIPYTNGKEMWLLEALDSINVGGAKFPAIKVSGFIPFAEQQGKNGNKEEIFFGSLTTNTVDGSWEND